MARSIHLTFLLLPLLLIDAVVCGAEKTQIQHTEHIYKVDTVVAFWRVRRLRDFMEKANNDFELHFYEGRKHLLAKGDGTYAEILDEEILEKTDTFLRRLGFL